MNNFKSTSILRYFLGLVFLSAGLYRILNWQSAILETQSINLPYTFIPIFIIVLEIVGGIFLILNIKTKIVLSSFVAFLTFVLVWSFIISGKTILSNVDELFIFNPTPTDYFLHLTYLIILVFLLSKKDNH